MSWRDIGWSHRLVKLEDENSRIVRNKASSLKGRSNSGWLDSVLTAGMNPIKKFVLVKVTITHASSIHHAARWDGFSPVRPSHSTGLKRIFLVQFLPCSYSESIYTHSLNGPCVSPSIFNGSLYGVWVE